MGRRLTSAIKVGLALIAFLCACEDAEKPASHSAAEAKPPIDRPLAYNRLSLRGRLAAPQNIRYRVDTKGGPKGIQAKDFSAIIAEAAAIWNRCALIRWVEDSASDGAVKDQVVFSWHQSDSNCQADLECRSACAHAGPLSNQSFVHFDPSRAWSLRGEAAEFGLLQAALHEMGHIVGLGHVDDKASLMYPAYDRKRIQPSAADLAGLEVLYATPPFKAEPGDLILALKDADFLRLPRVLQAGQTSWRLFDSNVDGRDEVLIFEETSGGLPRFTSFHFDESGQFSHTRGPIVMPAKFVDGCVLTFSQDHHALFLVPRQKPKTYAIYRFSQYGSLAGVWPKGLKLTTAAGWVDEEGDGVFEVWTAPMSLGKTHHANFGGRGQLSTCREIEQN